MYMYITNKKSDITLFDQQKCAEARKQKYMEKCEELFRNIDLDEFIQYYNSHYDKETMSQFGLTTTQLTLFCKMYNINKTSERFKTLSYRSRLQKYGNGTFRNVSKAKNTRAERYGDENYNNSSKIRETYLSKSTEEMDKISNRRKKTCLERFGYESSSQSPEIKEKTRQTNIKKYGVDWYCMTPQCRNFSANESQMNLKFSNFLDINGVTYTREYPISKYSYDFQIGKYLVEIDPFPYHNVTWNPFNDTRITEDYHQRKSLVAYNHGFICIHVFDWTNWDDVLSMLNSELKVKKFNAPRKHILDITTMEVVDQETDKTVLIYDDGVEYEHTV